MKTVDHVGILFENYYDDVPGDPRQDSEDLIDSIEEQDYIIKDLSSDLKEAIQESTADVMAAAMEQGYRAGFDAAVQLLISANRS